MHNALCSFVARKGPSTGYLQRERSRERDLARARCRRRGFRRSRRLLEIDLWFPKTEKRRSSCRPGTSTVQEAARRFCLERAAIPMWLPCRPGTSGVRIAAGAHPIHISRFGYPVARVPLLGGKERGGGSICRKMFCEQNQLRPTQMAKGGRWVYEGHGKETWSGQTHQGTWWGGI